MRFVFLLSFALLLAGCATPFPAEQMEPKPNVYTFLDKNKLTGNVAVDRVTLSEEMPTVGLIVTDAEFKKALQASLKKAGWLSTKTNPRYRLNANFVRHEIPFSLFNTKVFSIVDYELTDTVRDIAVYKKEITIPCVVTLGEVWDATQRQIEATRCSVSENVTHVLRDLNSQF